MEKNDEIIYPEIVVVNGAVGVENEFLGGQRRGFFQFGGQKKADGAQQLETAFRDTTDTQKSIHVVDCQPVDIRLALLFFANLQTKTEKR